MRARTALLLVLAILVVVAAVAGTILWGDGPVASIVWGDPSAAGDTVVWGN